KADPNSRYYKLQEQWLGLAGPRNLIPEWLAWTLYSLLGTIVLLLAVVLLVELRVRKRTRQIRRQKSALEEQDRQLTEQNRNLSELLQSRRALLDSVPAHIALLDWQGQILSVNNQWSNFHRKQSYFGANFAESENYIDLCLRFAPMESEGQLIARGIESVLSGKENQYSIEYPLHSVERLQWFRMMVNSLASDRMQDARQGAVVMHIDITERKVAELELNRLAFQDPVTGLPSRNGFVRSMRGRMERAGWKPQGVLLVMDVVSMRDINDAHGYEIGDQFLLNLSHRLREEAGHDGLAGRTGGDEFVLYLPTGDAEGSPHTPDSFFRLMAEPFLIAEVEVVISVRFGYTILGESRRSVESLLREAELALFRTREEVGQSWKAYTSDMDAATRERIALTREIRNALRNHQFEMYYQPKVALSDGAVVGCEALIRWNHPQHGMQSPALFIPVAEKSQLIAPLGFWILEEVCNQLRQWSDAGLEAVPVAINVSIVQFRGGDFPDRVAALLRKYSISPALLAFEVTESVFEKESILLQSQIQRLREMGIRLSLDDFGTGYSSLQYLQDYAFDEIKIDQGFVRNMSEHASEKIVETILGLSSAFHADVVAEGIETEEVRDRLIALGCTYGQGYFYSWPVPAAKFEEILKDKRIKHSA
ncbi:MAG: EAL domain-containing protein, partial [Leptospiraceae bacterium]|nr:EAL domain-containing protein [Leptospiraceae bacterium]